MGTWNDTYPRPSLVRADNWQILNDGWLLNGSPVQLPYPPESKLSGFNGTLSEAYTYTRDFTIPEEARPVLASGGHLILYFGAVDQRCTIYADDADVGRCELGYFKITCDITEKANEALAAGRTTIKLRVEGEDYLDHLKPYGKQRKDRGGMWYTPVSGIWQTVWCEWVSEAYIERFLYDTDIDYKGEVTVRMQAVIKNGDDDIRGTIHLPEGDYNFDFPREPDARTSHPGAGTSHPELVSGSLPRASINLSQIVINGTPHTVQFWSPENPYLYRITLETDSDRIESYFAVRSVRIREFDGYKRICINDKPVFLNGVLDQGYFQDGIFTPATPGDYADDIIRMKELGFNILRKHIKVEPEIFYYECDRLGMFVLQDMINNGDYNFWKDTVLATLGCSLDDRGRYPDTLQNVWFLDSAYRTQDMLLSNPCVIGYTVFNEGWGQSDSDTVGDELKECDPTRFYDYTSGWFAQKHSDVESVHVYFRNKKLKALGLPLLLSEFGGFTREVQGHIWNPDKSYGYGKCKDEKSLTDKIIRTYEKMVLPAIPRGLCGAIYTQLSDIEDEINGFYTYDRQVCKVDKCRIADFMKKISILC